MLKLTERQSEILDFINQFTRESGYPPTRVDISQALGFRSPNAAQSHLRALERKGAISLIPGSSRGIRVINEEPASDEGLPIIGQVSAGSPVLAKEHVSGHCRFDPGLFTPKADYLLSVTGMSMRDAGILDGDLLVVHRTTEASNGQIVVARLQDDVTVKRFRREGHTVWLTPENQEFPPLELDLRHDSLVIEGLGVGLIRNGKALG